MLARSAVDRELDGPVGSTLLPCSGLVRCTRWLDSWHRLDEWTGERPTQAHQRRRQRQASFSKAREAASACMLQRLFLFSFFIFQVGNGQEQVEWH